MGESRQLLPRTFTFDVIETLVSTEMSHFRQRWNGWGASLVLSRTKGIWDDFHPRDRPVPEDFLANISRIQEDVNITHPEWFASGATPEDTYDHRLIRMSNFPHYNHSAVLSGDPSSGFRKNLESSWMRYAIADDITSCCPLMAFTLALRILL